MNVSRRVARALPSVVGLGVLVAAVPAVLIAVARRRFGGAAPWHGVDPPWSWSAEQVADVVTSRVDDGVLLDVVVRVSLGAAWAAVVVLAGTVCAEIVHMVRHGGLAMPPVRGLGWSQRIARSIAVGLLLVVPFAARTQARTSSAAVLLRPATATAAVEVSSRSLVAPTPRPEMPRHNGDATAEAGLSIEGSPPSVPTEPDGAPGVQHVVQPGDTLWSIAGARLGDPTRWPEIWELNQARDMGGGRTFDDPDLILIGWVLDVPAQDVDDPVQPEARPEPVVVDAPSEQVDQPVGPAPTAVTSTVPDVARPMPTSTVPTTVPVEHDAATAPPGSPAPVVTSTTTPSPLGPPPDAAARPFDESPPRAPSPIGLGGAAMLSAGLVALLGVRRRRRLRAARAGARVPPPRDAAARTERALRAVDAGERLVRLDVAVRSVAMPLADGGRRVVVGLVAGDGSVELVLDGPCALDAPWRGDGARWCLPGNVALESLASAARAAGLSCVAFVQIGVTPAGEDVVVDLEAIGVLAVHAPPGAADAIVSAVAMTLGTSAFGEDAHLVGVGVDERVFVEHRPIHVADNVDEALEIAASLVGSTTAAPDSTFALRARHTAGERWEPAVVLVGSADASSVAAAVPDGRLPPGLALVAAGAVDGASYVLRDANAAWLLEPIGIELLPVGVSPDEVSAVHDLLADVDIVATSETIDRPDHRRPAVGAQRSTIGETLVITEPAPRCASSGELDPPWSLLVRLFGPVDVVDRELRPVPFDRSKTRELVAWLATHRERSTRTAARTALWELDVRDATFANVVSEARRAMARLVAPPEGGEWLGRTLTEDLPLHEAVVTDADLIGRRLAAARSQPPDVAVEILEPAIGLIRGMPFEGTTYLWPDAEGLTSNLVLLATSAASECAAHLLSMGDVAGVFRATGQGLLVLPGHEELIALRMRAHGRAGDLAGVRQEWESYERVITGDPWSDGEPAPKLIALRRALLSSTT
jgi:LysM domain